MKDSAPEKWEYREHTRVKHILLSKYLKVWLTALGKFNPRICYFDGFAGRGEYADGTLGSPLLALKLADKLCDYFSELICCFVEKDPSNHRNLTEVLEREKPSITHWPGKIIVQEANDEFSHVIDELLDGMQEGHTLIPSFFFIDPFGFSGVPFQTVARILSNPKTEVFFTFMARDLSRFYELKELESTVSLLFGTGEWKRIASGMSGQTREEVLIHFYREQLHDRAGVKFSWPFRVCSSDRAQTLYYLVHATNHHTGHRVMKDIMYKESAQGNFEYLGPQDFTARVQMTLFDVNKLETLKEHLLGRFVGRTVGYETIQFEVCSPWYQEPPYAGTHYNQALKDLEKEKRVTVNRVTSKTAKGLQGKDEITFPAPTTTQGVASNTRAQSVRMPTVHFGTPDWSRSGSRAVVTRVNDGSVITRFDKTPPPTTQTSVVCPHFMELKWAYGCPFDCAWCYLKGTLRFQPGKTKPVFKDQHKVALHTTRFLEEAATPEILNTGEIADSLMGEGLSEPFSRFIVPLFEGQDKHKVLFLTKSDNVKHLFELESHRQVIVSFSLNADAVARSWENGAPSVTRRIAAGQKLSAAGYEVRVRIDPIVPIPNWEHHYGDLVRQLFASFTPERITLGSLRGLQSTVNGSSDKSWVAYLEEKSNWGKKVRFETRRAAFQAIIDVLARDYDYRQIALCKETVAMWEALGMDYGKMRCNCIW